MFSNRVEITLISILGTMILEYDPIGFRQKELDIKRSEATNGIFLTQINNLEFVGKAKSYLENLYALKGVHAKCQLIRKEKHPTTDDWRLDAIGSLDFYSRNIKENKLSLDFVEGGLREILTSQMREKFELDRIIDINGRPIPALLTDTLSNKGRDIYLLSKLASENETFRFQSGIWSSGDSRESFAPFPYEVVANSDPLNISSPYESYGIEERWKKSLLNCFFENTGRDIGKVVLNFSYEWSEVSDIHIEDASNVNIRVVLDQYENGTTLNLKKRHVIQELGSAIPGSNSGGGSLVLIHENGWDIKAGDSFAIGLYVTGEYGGGISGNGDISFDANKFNGTLTWSEDSFFKRTNSPCLTAYNVGKRLSEIYTGKNCFESHLLDGKDPEYLKNEDHNLVFAPGGWLRNLKKKDENGNLLPWPMEMNFEDFYKSIHAILPVGYGISTVGNSQRIVLESLRFFFQRTVMGNLGKIQIKGRSTAAEYCYQSLKFGYVKGGDYEQPLGLDEYNTQTDYRTPLTGTDNIYEALGPSRTDSYGAEGTRRKPYKDFPDEDTNEDKDNFLFDVKFISRSNQGSYFEPRTYTDDFETVPTGIYSPETAFNLNLSPARNKKRHEYWWSNSIIMLQDEEIQFSNSKGNSELKTKKAGEDALQERENILISKVTNPLFKPEWIDAEAPFSQDILDKLLGSTLINGRMINNYYGLWEFTNEQNRTEHAYIFSVKSKDKFTYKLLKAYGI
jgi:hypothetical protein